MSSIANADPYGDRPLVQPELVDLNQINSAFYFSLALTPKTLPDTLIVAGDIGALTELNLWHSLAEAWRWPVELASSERTYKLLGSMIAPVDTALARLHQSSVLGVGYGMHIGSREQLWLEKALSSEDFEVAYVTAEIIPLFLHNTALLQSRNIIPVWSVAECISLLKKLHVTVRSQPGRGLYNVAALLGAMPLQSDMICLYDAERIYMFVRSTGKMLHIPRDARLERSALRTILSSMLMLICNSNRRSGSLEDCARATLQLMASIRASQSADDIARECRVNIERWAA